MLALEALSSREVDVSMVISFCLLKDRSEDRDSWDLVREAARIR